jgi:hypothetical protein
MSDQLATLEDRLRRLDRSSTSPRRPISRPRWASGSGPLRDPPAPRARSAVLVDWVPRVAVAALAAIAVLAVTLSVSPAARAAVRSILRRIPGVEISSDRPPPARPSVDATAPTAAPAPTGSRASAPSPAPSASTTPAPSPTRLVVPGDKVSLARARSVARFRLRVPAELGPPDEVYVDAAVAGRAVSFIWSADGCSRRRRRPASAPC